MFAVFEHGSRQYRVQEGDVVKLDFRSDDAVGSEVEFTRVLLCQKDEDTKIGAPTVDGAKIMAEVVDHPTTKLYVQHFRRRKNYRRLRGHRQKYTSVQIRTIEWPGMPTSPPESESSPEQQETSTDTPDENGDGEE